jgi:hypothetical protein
MLFASTRVRDRSRVSKWALSGALALSALGCAGQQRSEPTAQRDESAVTIASAANSCQRVQENVKVPVGCSTDYVKGVLSMMIRFGSEVEVETYLQPMATHVAEPFCAAANRASRQARVYMTVENSRARYWDCELSRWSAWFAIEGDASSNAVAAAEDRNPFSEALATCQRVQRDADLPVSCETQYTGSVPTMVVGFRDDEAADRLMNAVIDQVTAPFCEGAAVGHSSAVVYFVFFSSHRGRGFNCTSNQWGEWFAFPGSDQPSAPAQAASTL